MRGYRIDIDGVRAVLTSVVRAGEDLSTHEREADTFSAEAPAALAPASRVGGVLAGVLAARGGDVATTANRTRAVLDAASAATEAYLLGDEAMASDTRAGEASVLGQRQ